MPIFLLDEEYERCSHDASLVAEKADAFIKQLLNQLEMVKAEAEAAAITAEQTCSLLEQKYVPLFSEFSSLQAQHSQPKASLDERISELSQFQAEKHQIQLHLEKELVERHNSTLNDELKAKGDSLIQLPKTRSELESAMSAKLADMEKRCKESWNGR